MGALNLPKVGYWTTVHCRGTTWWGNTTACYVPKSSALRAVSSTTSLRPMQRYESYLLGLQAWRLALGMGGRKQVAQMVYTEKSGVIFSKYSSLPLKCPEHGVINLEKTKKEKRIVWWCPILVPDP